MSTAVVGRLAKDSIQLPVHRLEAYVRQLRHELGVASPLPVPDMPPRGDATHAKSLSGADSADAVHDNEHIVLIDGHTARCGVCGIGFFDYLAQRAHCRSQWHVNNVKRVAAGKAPFHVSADDEMEIIRRKIDEVHAYVQCVC